MRKLLSLILAVSFLTSLSVNYSAFAAAVGVVLDGGGATPDATPSGGAGVGAVEARFRGVAAPLGAGTGTAAGAGATVPGTGTGKAATKTGAVTPGAGAVDAGAGAVDAGAGAVDAGGAGTGTRGAIPATAR